MFEFRTRTFLLLLAACGLVEKSMADSISLTPGGQLSWNTATVPSVLTLEESGDLVGAWEPRRNVFATNSAGTFPLGFAGSRQFFRTRSSPVPPTAQGFTNLVFSYGILETIAGSGVGQADVNYWSESYEGEAATSAVLSRPHFAMADEVGNIYIADKNSHSILKVSPDGIITTLAGTHSAGFNGEGPAPARELQLNFPNGEWVRADGTVYVLDTGNGRIRRVATNGIMSTLFLANNNGSAISGGRGVWVKDDESLAYFCAGTRVKKWTPSDGVKDLAADFQDLANLLILSNGDLLVCDRGAHYIYRVTASGAVSAFAGNGTATGGADGSPALQTGLYGPRGIWPVPTGGYLVLTHDGCQLWYLDSAGTMRVLLNGGRGRTHAGDGSFFYGADPKISEGRSVTMDYAGNIIVCESDYGYVRRIRFAPLSASVAAMLH